MNITVIGNVCIDKNTSENSTYEAAGSPPVYISKIYNQIPDAKTTVIAPYGQDFLDLQTKINLYPLQNLREHTLVYENITKGNFRSQKAYFREFAKPIDLDVNLEKIIKESDVLFFAPILPNISRAYIENVFKFIKKDCITILLPQGYFRDFDENNNVIKRQFIEEDKIIPFFDIVIISEQDLINPFEKAKKWANDFGITTIITTGENGAIAVNDKEELKVPTVPVLPSEIVDSVGSGDIFSAVFAYEYFRTKSLKQSIEKANEIARQCLFFTPENIKIRY